MNTANPLSVILDTDIGPDCDDAGALAVLHALAVRGEAEILAVTHCTSNPFGAGCIDAINRFCGRGNIPVGTLSRPAFLDEGQYQRYNKYITLHYDNAFRDRQPPDATNLLRRILSSRAEKSLDIIGIGPLVNLAALLTSPPDELSQLDGRALVARTVRRLVCMAGRFERNGENDQPIEWNVEMEIDAARAVFDIWPADVVFCPHEIGVNVITGKKLLARCGDENPVKKAYELYTNGAGRSSWDLITILFAIRGLCDMWEYSPEGVVRINERGASVFSSAPGGRHRYLKAVAPAGAVERYLEDLILPCA
jgi:inosine-uridine nucleoside N-ribohydrolase